jgi:hypothetical protein
MHQLIGVIVARTASAARGLAQSESAGRRRQQSLPDVCEVADGELVCPS